MKTSSKKFIVVLIATLLVTFLSMPIIVRAINYNVVSNDRWDVFEPNGNYLGKAQNVCLNASNPANCPTNATQFGFPQNFWTANLSNIPGATWIWAPNINSTTSSAANAEFTFQWTFWICDVPKPNGMIFLAADNSAAVFINNTRIADTTSFSTLSSFAIPPNVLVKDLNTIEIKAKNGPDPSNCGSGQYQCNPAGLVFGASIEDALATAPECTSKGIKYKVGDSEDFPCGAGKVGKKFRICYCNGPTANWTNVIDGCTTPPPTCTKNDGTIVNVGDTEPVDCPQGRIGSASRTCTANGWGSNDYSRCTTPPPTCTKIDGTIVNVGDTESVDCPQGRVGSAYRTCTANGWSPNDDSACQLPLVGEGDICGSIDVTGVYTATCPVGTECQTRLLPSPPRTIWCALFGIDCPVRLRTTDWFCDPP